ncbi:hypothetical protein BH18ACT5_BH18ACT5_05250 [soil metagenome]
MKDLARLLGCTAILVAVAMPALATDAPSAVDDFVDADGGTAHIYVLANDIGDFDPATLNVVSGPSRGSADVIAQGSPKIKYSVAGGEPGSDTFQYSICNSAGACSVATVTINIGSQPSPITTTTTTTLGVAPPSTTQPPAVPPTGTASPPTTVPLATDPVVTATTTVPPTTTAAVDPIAELALETRIGNPSAGTTVGEPRGIRFDEDIRYLGRSGRDTLAVVAVPAIMVSGLVGFLMIGLPQNAVGAGLGFLFGFRRKTRKPESTPASTEDGESPG